MSSPFSSGRSRSGEGLIHLALLPPQTPRLKSVHYQYPLKLVSPAPITIKQDENEQLVHTVYLLTYGGGLVAGDAIDLKIIVEGGTRLTLLTQGSTKLFKSPSRDISSRQHTTTRLEPGSALCYLPDPVQPFEHSAFQQRQVYEIVSDKHPGSVCALDWVSNGRSANGENWSFFHYTSCNELYMLSGTERRLLLRDNLVLDDHGRVGTITARMQSMAVFGTLILHGPRFKPVADFFMNEFKQLPRVGGRQWDEAEAPKTPVEQWRAARIAKEAEHILLWSAASIRGCVVVKLGARELEHARHWLFDMLTRETSIEAHFGERALLCLR